MLSYPMLRALGPEFLMGAVVFLMLFLSNTLRLPSKLKTVPVIILTAAGVSMVLLRWNQPSIVLSDFYIDDKYTFFFKLSAFAWFFLSYLVLGIKNEEIEPRNPIVYLSAGSTALMLMAGSLNLIFSILSAALFIVCAVLTILPAFPGRTPAVTRYLQIQFFIFSFIVLGAGLPVFSGSSLNIRKINDFLLNGTVYSEPLFYLGFFMVFSGLLAAFSILPFHGALRDLTDLIPVSRLLIILTGSAAAVIALLGRWFYLISFFEQPVVPGILNVFLVTFLSIAVLSIFVQKTLNRKIFHFVSAHALLILLGVSMVDRTQMLETLVSGFQLVYLQVIAFLFAGLGLAIYASNCISDDPGTERRSTVHSAILHPSIYILSLAGIPLTLGFLTKFNLATSLIIRAHYIEAAVLIVNYLLLFICAVIILANLRQKFHPVHFDRFITGHPFIWVLMIIISAFLLAAGCFPTPLLELLSRLSNPVV